MGFLMKTAFILCTRTDSSRVPRKVFKYINGKPLITHLINRLQATGIEVILAAPMEQKEEFEYLKSTGVKFFFGEHSNPLARMKKAADVHNVDNIIRVTHDKLFIDSELVHLALMEYLSTSADYLYSSSFTEGSGFEIISKSALDSAFKEIKIAEHISYAVRAVAKNMIDFSVPKQFVDLSIRLLLDYEEDFNVAELLLSQLGNDCSLQKAINYLSIHTWAKNLNKLPLVTFYTCVYNGGKYIGEAISSVINQDVFNNSEYLIIDDHSVDKSAEVALMYKTRHKNIDFFRNPKNVGLSTSSNIALKVSKGKYIIRLDADDYFLGSDSVTKLISKLTETNSDVVYADNQFGEEHIQKAELNHHVGGALFKTSAINHLKFKDGLRGHDSLDLWLRARKVLNIAYLNEPVFYYRQHKESLTRNNLEERYLIKSKIERENNAEA